MHRKRPPIDEHDHLISFVSLNMRWNINANIDALLIIFLNNEEKLCNMNLHKDASANLCLLNVLHSLDMPTKPIITVSNNPTLNNTSYKSFSEL